MKIKTNKAILFFWDMELDEPRRVMFGDPIELYDFLMEQSEIAHRRLRKMAKEYESKEEMLKAVEDTREDFETEHAKEVHDKDARLEVGLTEISYEII
jgi:vacuolar-type H+-ATPase subunit I/STV1